mmetsp:Transcript_55413/g.124547  ORF Transcript_55413/g.124547 Transcript_55413/m.124547 type:complete len:420 (-) Transcript_55413:34-1293(-)
MHLLLTFFALVLAPRASHGWDVEGLKNTLQEIANEMHTKYDMSLAAAVHAPWAQFQVAAGYTDRGLGMGAATRKAEVDDAYVWGSTTKMFTAPAVLQLVERGLVSLKDRISVHIDPVLKHIGLSLEQHFGADIHAVQIIDLLHMTSGIADYDGISYTRDQFANRSKSFSPVEIIFNYTPSAMTFAPGTRQEYCSTNYVMLGLVLLRFQHSEAWAWQSYNQKTVIPAGIRNQFNESKFALSGPCDDISPVHGYMESYGHSQLPPQETSNVSCLGGWTAGNYVGSVRDVAHFTYELYSQKSERVISLASKQLLTNFTPFNFYGVGTFNLAWSVGGGIDAYGHVGDTYGYQSQTTYFPVLDFAITVGTNIETNSQAQPADFTCIAYHALVANMSGSPRPSCTFTVPRRFIGTCTCHDEVLIV